MVAAVGNPEELVALPKPDRLPDGKEPEGRVVVCGVSWESYLEFDRSLGDDRPGPRFYYLDGELEITTTSREHERLREWIGGLLDLYCDYHEIETFAYGQATLRTSLRAAGAEPDESWCLHLDKSIPDFVLEIALTSGGIPKLEVYRRFKIPEVWIWRKGRLEVFRLSSSGHYEQSAGSQLLPGLDLGLIEKCLALPTQSAARKMFRAALSAP